MIIIFSSRSIVPKVNIVDQALGGLEIYQREWVPLMKLLYFPKSINRFYKVFR